MNKRNILYLMLLLSIIVLSCSDNKKVLLKENQLQLLSVKESYLDEKYNFYDIIDDIEFVPLETTSESIIGSIKKIKFYKNYMIILDESSRSILIFDNNGKYIDKISRIGTGPYEYIDINDFCVHPQTGEISIATSSRKILTFSFDLKKCTLYNKTPYAVGIERFNNGNYALSSTEAKSNVFVTDSNMNIINKGLSNPFEDTELLCNSFSRYGDTVLCRLPTCYNDTIYRITETSFVPWFAPDFEVHTDYSNLKECFVDDLEFGNRYFNPKMSMASFDIFFETDKFILFPMLYPKKYGNNQVSFVLFTKKYNKVRVVNPYDIMNPPFSMPLYFISRGEYSDKIVQGVSASQILNCKILKEDAIGLRIKELKAQLNEESNPVIMFMRFKE